jgi:hypothetical protein
VDDAIRVFSGRTISPEDIELIKWARKTYPKLPRYEFAGTVCELLDWNTPEVYAMLLVFALITVHFLVQITVQVIAN